MKSVKAQKTRYNITPDFERAVVRAETTSPRFHGLLGAKLRPEYFPTLEAQYLIMAAHAVALVTDNGCTDGRLAVQHLLTLHDSGKMKIEEVQSCEEYLNECEEYAFSDIEGVVKLLVPIIQKIEGRLVVADTLLKVGKDSVAYDEIASDLQKVADIGKKKTAGDITLSSDVSFLDEVLENRLVDPMPTGIDELDMLIGGLERKAIGCVVAPSGAGKSFFLCHLSVEALLQGVHVAYLSLELSETQILERVYANLVDMTLDEMVLNKKKAAERMEILMGEGIGSFHVVHETPRATTPNHFRQWLADLDDRGHCCEMMVCDFADKMVSKLQTKKSAYDDQGVVYDALRDLAFEREGWMWTASQAKAAAYGKKKVGATHFADSLNKLRSLDLGIGLARTEQDEENNQVRFGVPKRRQGEGHFEVGPLDWDPERGRICYVTRDYPWEMK